MGPGFITEVDATIWENIEPYTSDLLQRELSCSGCLESLIADASELSEHVSEAGALLYIEMTCDTENEDKKVAFLTFVSVSLQTSDTLGHL